MPLIPIFELNKNIKNIKHAYTNMHINSNSSPPFCQSSTKGLKTKLIKTYSIYIQKQGIKNKGCSSPFCLNTNMIPIRRKSVKKVHIDTN